MADTGVSIVQTSQQDAGRPGTSVFTALNTPPTTGVAAETAVKTRSAAKGTSAPASVDVLALRYQNRDYYRDDADVRSIKNS